MEEDESVSNFDNNGVDYSSLGATRSIAKQFEEGDDPRNYYDESTTGHIPYKYDDALKYRFPEQKDYVAAHNYIPTGGTSGKLGERGAFGNRGFNNFDSSQPKRSFNRDFRQFVPPPVRRRGASENGGSSYYNSTSNRGRGRGFVSNTARNINRSIGGEAFSDTPLNDVSPGGGNRYGDPANALGHRRLAPDEPLRMNRELVDKSVGQSVGHSVGQSFYKVPVYTYEDEESLFNAIRDGTYDLSTHASDAASISGVRAKYLGGFSSAGGLSLQDPGSTMYNYRRLHPLATAPTTGEKAYFNMNPRIYDYEDNTYHPITVDTDLMRSEAKRLHGMGLNSKDIA